jgi:hypothetical protein
MEKQAFESIAVTKGSRIHWDVEIPQTEEFHLDLNMIDASLDAAIVRLRRAAIRESQHTILHSLEQLRANGSYADRVDFVFGKGPYYFRDGIDRVVESAFRNEHRTSGVCHTVCEIITYPVCRCVCVMLYGVRDCDQYCTDRSRSVCRMVCD